MDATTEGDVLDQQFRRHADSSSLGMFLVRCKPEPRLIHANDRLQQLVPYEPQALADDPIGLGGLVHPQDQGLVAGRQPDEIGVLPEVRVRVRAPDGSWRWTRLGHTTFQDDRGEMVAVQGRLEPVVPHVHSELDRLAPAAEVVAVPPVRPPSSTWRVLVVDQTGLLDSEQIPLGALPASWDLARSEGVHTQQLASLGDGCDLAVVLVGGDAGAVGAELTRAMVPLAALPVVVVTTGEAQDLARHALAVGAQDCVDLRAWRAGSLPRIAEYAVERHRLRRELDATIERLASSERRYRHLAERGGDVVYLLGTRPRLEFLFVNEAFEELTGCSYEELVDNPKVAFDLVHPESRPTLDALLADAAEVDDAPVTMRLTTRDGRDVWLEQVYSPTRDAGGDVAEVLVVGRDVTDRHRASRQLAERLEEHERTLQELRAQKLEEIGRLVSGVAHELNSPLQFVADNNRFVQEVLDELFESMTSAGLWDAGLEGVDLELVRDEVPTALSESLAGLARMAALVRALKDFSHPGQEEQTMHDLNEVVRTVATVARNEWKYVAKLELDLADDLPTVLCHGDQIGQVLLNLVVNAAHAIGDRGRQDGRIRVETSLRDESVLIRVADDGPGMPDEVAARAFEPFFTTKAAGVGTGQGLAIARTIIEDRHHGRLRIEQTGPNGTTFRLELPITSIGDDHGTEV